MRKIETLKQVQALIGETYMYAVIVAIAAIVLAFLVANIIKWGGGRNDISHIKRRIWYIMIGVAAPIAFFLYNALYVSSFITKLPLKSEFSTSNILATLVIFGIYVIIGILTMLIMRRSKWGSIIGRSKK